MPAVHQPEASLGVTTKAPLEVRAVQVEPRVRAGRRAGPVRGRGVGAAAGAVVAGEASPRAVGGLDFLFIRIKKG